MKGDYDFDQMAPISGSLRRSYRTPRPAGPAARPPSRACGTAFEVFAEGGAERLAREMSWLPKPGARFAAGKGARRVEGIVTRVVRGEIPSDDAPGRLTRVYLAVAAVGEEGGGS